MPGYKEINTAKELHGNNPGEGTPGYMEMNMGKQITEYEPKNLWKYFAAISAIPRESGNETQAVDFLEQLAKEKGREYRRDDAGNIVMKIPASDGFENAPTVILQGHIDMVCVKTAESKHDFTKDGIELQIDGDWLSAKNTTLGADNGIGVSAALSVADETDVVHPPLEILVTVDEEVGMTGASRMPSDMVSGKILINLDSMDLGHFYIGCAGGGDCVISCPVTRVPFIDGTHLRLRISGLSGGHSGLEIHKNTANSNKLLARILYRALDLGIGISSINGGTKRNVIPSESIATVVIPNDKINEFKKIMDEEESLARQEYSTTDPGMKYQLDDLNSIAGEHPVDMIESDAAIQIVLLLETLPHGVLAMSRDVDDLVETSNNVGVVTDKNDSIEIICTHRSSVDASKIAVRNQIIAASKLAGADVVVEHDYPGWAPNLDSRLLQMVNEAYQESFDDTGIPEAKHAGLETGLLLKKIPGLDLISFGPDIRDAHSVDERTHIGSVADFYKLLKAVLSKVAREYE
jgi:dipeptidase D